MSSSIRAADLLWSMAVALALSSPVLRPGSGRSPMRPAIAARPATLVCGLASALLLTVGRGDVIAGIALHVCATRLDHRQAASTNSHLPLLATPQRAARLSLAWGLSRVAASAASCCAPIHARGITCRQCRALRPCLPVTAALRW
jgi:hypothetical protein